MPKYERYQDYVIRDGRLIGEFEQMYRDFADPWHESTSEEYASDKAAGLNLLARLKARHGIRRVVEVGCGFGHYSERIADLGLETVGLDIAATAIERARKLHPAVEFRVGEFHNFHALKQERPDVLVLAEVTWYVLDHLRTFLEFARRELPNTYILHLLCVYPPGVQEYGLDYFTDLVGIKKFFNMEYLESGEVKTEEAGARTWFLGTWNRAARVAWNAPVESR
jgi:SAM-dependent methyltransferase